MRAIPRRLARKDVGAGLLFIAVALLGLWLSRDYPVGTALRMGTGYVPRLLCWLLLGLGIIITAQGLREGEPERLRPVETFAAAVVLIVLSWAIFIAGLGLAIPVWPEW